MWVDIHLWVVRVEVKVKEEIGFRRPGQGRTKVSVGVRLPNAASITVYFFSQRFTSVSGLLGAGGGHAFSGVFSHLIIIIVVILFAQ